MFVAIRCRTECLDCQSLGVVNTLNDERVLVKLKKFNQLCSSPSNLNPSSQVPKNRFVSFMDGFRKLWDPFVSSDRLVFETVRLRILNGSFRI